MVVTSQLRTGSVFKVGNDALVVQKILGQKTGRAGTVTRFRVKNIVTGQTSDVACSIWDAVSRKASALMLAAAPFIRWACCSA